MSSSLIVAAKWCQPVWVISTVCMTTGDYALYPVIIITSVIFACLWGSAYIGGGLGGKGVGKKKSASTSAQIRTVQKVHTSDRREQNRVIERALACRSRTDPCCCVDLLGTRKLSGFSVWSKFNQECCAMCARRGTLEFVEFGLSYLWKNRSSRRRE